MGEVNDVGSPSVNTLLECKQRCDATPKCGAISWNGNYRGCLMTTSMAYTTSEENWKCYSKLGEYFNTICIVTYLYSFN